MAHITIRPNPAPSPLGRIREELKKRRSKRKVVLIHQMEDVCGLTMTGLAVRTGVDISYISRIFSGARVPSLDTSVRLAAALQMTLQEFADILIPPEQLAMINAAVIRAREEKPTIIRPRYQSNQQRAAIKSMLHSPTSTAEKE